MGRKISRTYRLTEEALAVIDGRDRMKYPTANDFVERRILETLSEEQERDILKELGEIRRDMDSLKELIKEYGGAGRKEREYALPVAGF